MKEATKNSLIFYEIFKLVRNIQTEAIKLVLLRFFFKIKNFTALGDF